MRMLMLMDILILILTTIAHISTAIFIANRITIFVAIANHHHYLSIVYQVSPYVLVKDFSMDPEL